MGGGNGDDENSMRDQSKATTQPEKDGEIFLAQSAMGERCNLYRRTLGDKKVNLHLDNLHAFRDIISSNDSIKFYFSVKLLYHQAKDPNDVTDPPVVHNSNVFTHLSDETELDNHIEQAYKKIISDIKTFEQNGSGWVVDELLSIDMGILPFIILFKLLIIFSKAFFFFFFYF